MAAWRVLAARRRRPRSSCARSSPYGGACSRHGRADGRQGHVSVCGVEQRAELAVDETRELVFEPGAGFPYYDTFVTVMRFRSERGQSILGDLRPRGAFVAIALEVDRRPRR